VLYSFYKNVVISLSLFQFQFYCGYSGTALYQSTIFSTYNFALGWPPLFLGMLDCELSEQFLLKNPEYYLAGSENTAYRALNNRKMVHWILTAVYHSYVLMQFGYFAAKTNNVDLYAMGTTLYLALVFGMLLKCAFETKTFATWTAAGHGVR
jgi:phospholipid-translocating ATPase